MKKLLALLFAAVPCAAPAADAPVYPPSPCEPVAASVCGPVGESVATEATAGTACPGGVCQINVDVSSSCPDGICAVASNGPPVAKQVRAWSRTVSRCGQTGFARTFFARNICAARQTASSRRAVATAVVRSTGTCATATAAPPLPCAPVCR